MLGEGEGIAGGEGGRGSGGVMGQEMDPWTKVRQPLFSAVDWRANLLDGRQR